MNFLNCDDNLKSAIDKHFVQNRPAGPHPLFLYKDPLGEGKWEGPVELLTWGRGYVCISSPEGLLELAVKRVKPYHRQGFPGSDPPPLHWTLPIQTSLSVCHPSEVEFQSGFLGRYSSLPAGHILYQSQRTNWPAPAWAPAAAQWHQMPYWTEGVPDPPQ